jgi:tellurite methyltransferase
MKYDEAYRAADNVFGAEPERILKLYFKKLSGLRPFLDQGAGQGRNALFLARHGFAVDAVDPSAVAIDALSRQTADETLAIRTHLCGFETFVPPVDFFSGVGAFGLIPALARKSIDELVDRIAGWTGPGSLIFLTAFTTADPLYASVSRDWTPVGRNSFADDEGRVRTYLDPGEIMGLFDGFEPLHNWEGLGQSHRHGDGPFERHAMAEAVFRRPK